MSCLTKMVAKRAIFDLVPDKLRILQKETVLGAHEKKKNRKSNYKKVELIRIAVKSYYKRRTKLELRSRTAFATTAASANNTTTADSTTTTTTSDLLLVAWCFHMFKDLIISKLNMVLRGSFDDFD